MDKYKILLKKDFPKFVSKLTKIAKVVAPVAEGVKNFAFKEVRSAEEIALKYIPTILPPKKYFMPQKERLVEFDTGKDKWDPVLEYDELVLLAVHTCDLAGIQCLNMVFSDKPKDINYLARKNRMVIIGLECNDYCDDYASCAVMDNNLPNGGYDLFFIDIGEAFMVHVNTLTGEELIKKVAVFSAARNEHMYHLQTMRQEKMKKFKDEISVKYNELKSLFNDTVESKVWEDIQKRCLACSNCTNVCPTCYCFDVRDEINLNLKSGYRYRVWDSCQSEAFAKVAGGENFRKERAMRQRHRYLRKFSYPVNKYSRYFCTGCGRCSRTCMAKINLKETIDTLAKEKA